MHNTTQTHSAQIKDMDILQRILHLEDLQLETFQQNTSDLITELDPDDFLCSAMNDCNYFSHEQYESLINFDGKLSLIHLNSRSMYKHFDSIKDYLLSFTHPFSVIAISETWFDIERGIHFNLDGYELIYNNRISKNSGGVALYIHKSLKFNIVPNMSTVIDGIMECLTIEIQFEQKSNVIVSCVYRTHGSNIEMFNECMVKLFSTLNTKPSFICGDFNIDLLNPGKLKSFYDFADTMYSLSLYPMITRPSRITSHSATIIDNIFTNVLGNLTTSGLLISDISDHLPVFTLFDCELKKMENSTQMLYKREKNEQSINGLIFSLSIQDWSPVYNEVDVDKSYDTFLDIFMSLYDEHCPVKELLKKSKRNKSPWLTKGIINACKKKNNLYKLFIKSKTVEAELRYKRYRNKLTDIIRSSKQLYYRQLLYENKNNIKRTWDTLNSLIKNGCSKSMYPEYFIDKNNEHHNKTEIVNSFNNYFVNIGPQLAAEIPNRVAEASITRNQSTFFLSAITEQELVNVVLKCKSKSSTDCYDIDMTLVKNIIFHIAKPLTYICNLSFQSGCFPDKMKVAKVLPLFKNGNKHYFTNYRPISLLPQFSKILEKLFNSRLESFLDKHHIINEGQYGFRKQRTTSMAILDAIEGITTNLNEKKIVAGVFIDLKKAFDTINHSILLDKLDRYGIRGVSGDWLKSYLTNRTQYVVMGKHSSEHFDITCGVPQGSVLGPTLFNMYINDIFDVSKSLKFILFADDTTIFCSSENYDDLVSTLNVEMNRVKHWLDVNKLSLNLNKTKIMLFSSSNSSYSEIDLIIDGVQIETVNENAFLGVIIDSNISWKAHIRLIKTKISKSISIINRVKFYLDKNALRSLYCTMVLPYFMYCVEIWGNTYQCTIDPLVKLQKRAVRIIHKVGFRDHTHNLFINSRLLKFNDLVKYSTVIVFYKAFNKTLPSNLQQLFIQRGNTHNFRGYGKFKQPHAKNNRKRFCVSVCGVKLWNNLKTQHKQSQNIHRFKLTYKNMVWSQYEESES